LPLSNTTPTNRCAVNWGTSKGRGFPYGIRDTRPGLCADVGPGHRPGRLTTAALETGESREGHLLAVYCVPSMGGRERGLNRPKTAASERTIGCLLLLWRLRLNEDLRHAIRRGFTNRNADQIRTRIPSRETLSDQLGARVSGVRACVCCILVYRSCEEWAKVEWNEEN